MGCRTLGEGSVQGAASRVVTRASRFMTMLFPKMGSLGAGVGFRKVARGSRVVFNTSYLQCGSEAPPGTIRQMLALIA